MQHLQLKILISVLEWSDKYMHKCQCHQSNVTPPQIYAQNTKPTVVAAYLEVLGDFPSCKNNSKKQWKTFVCAWLRSTFKLLATLFFLQCYTVFMIHLFTNIHPDAVFEQHFTFSQITTAAEQKWNLVWQNRNSFFQSYKQTGCSQNQEEGVQNCQPTFPANNSNCILSICNLILFNCSLILSNFHVSLFNCNLILPNCHRILLVCNLILSNCSLILSLNALKSLLCECNLLCPVATWFV